MRRGTLNWSYDDDEPNLRNGAFEGIAFSQSTSDSSSVSEDGRHLAMFDRCVAELREKILAVVNRGKAKEGAGE